DEGNWDTRPHPERIIEVDTDVLKVWGDVLDEPGTLPVHARMVYPVNNASMKVLEKLSQSPRVRELGLQYSPRWHETADRKRGYFEIGSKINNSWENVILQGPHFTVANPFSKQPNPTMRNNLDWTEIDLESLPEEFVPRTSYQPIRASGVSYSEDYGNWNDALGGSKPVLEFYRLTWRRMSGLGGVRSLNVSAIPPGAAHVHPVYSMGGSWNARDLLIHVGSFSSIVSDFFIKISGSSEIQFSMVENLPTV